MKNANFLKFSKKGLLNFVGRRSRINADFINPNVMVDDNTYFKQMKQFIHETQGVPRNSQKWFDLRNKHYRILAQIHNEMKKSETKESLEMRYIRFYVFIVPEEIKCYEIVTLLNYYNLKYKALEDSPISKSILKQMLGLYARENYKNCSYPFMIYESSEDPRHTLDGFDNIIQFLIENKFIHDFRSHSAYEKEGLVFTEEFEKLFQEEFKKWKNKFSFYFRTTNFKEARYWYNPYIDGYVYRNRLFSRIYRFGKYSLKNFEFKKFIGNVTGTFLNLITKFTQIFSKKNKTLSEKNVNSTHNEKLEQLINKFVSRLNKNSFHGGDIPDAADFRLYAIIRKYTVCRGINSDIKKLENYHFDDWISRMNILCMRSNFYNIREAGYTYNPNEPAEKEEPNSKEEVKKQNDVKRTSFVLNKTRRSKFNI